LLIEFETQPLSHRGRLKFVGARRDGETTRRVECGTSCRTLFAAITN